MIPSKVTVAASGECWVGRGARSVEQLQIDVVSHARTEIQMLAYSITTGASSLLDSARQRGELGVKVMIVVNRFRTQPVSARRLLAKSVGSMVDCAVYSFEPPNSKEDMHAKVVVVDRSTAIIGSANFSWSGLTRNHELCVAVSGAAAETLGGLIRSLVDEGPVRRVLASGRSSE